MESRLHCMCDGEAVQGSSRRVVYTDLCFKRSLHLAQRGIESHWAMCPSNPLTCAGMCGGRNFGQTCVSELSASRSGCPEWALVDFPNML